MAELLSADKYPSVYSLLKIQGDALVSALELALPREKDATGGLRDSIHFEIKRFGLTYRFELYLADYYEWVDNGRAPGKQPPIESIIKWIKDKRLVIHSKYGLQAKYGKSKIKQVSDNLRQTRSLAFAIARKIGRRGTKGNNFYSNTVPAWVENLKIELPKALKRDVLVEIRSI
jgi:hypothetical protein